MLVPALQDLALCLRQSNILETISKSITWYHATACLAKGNNFLKCFLKDLEPDQGLGRKNLEGGGRERAVSKFLFHGA